MKRRAGPLALLLVSLAGAATALAAPTNKELASEAYGRGLAADKRGDHAKAAEEFARADELMPNAVALRAALDAAVQADDPVLGSELVERAARDSKDAQLVASATKARDRFAGRAGKVRLVCPASGRCLGSLDGAPLVVGKATWAKVGTHRVIIQIDDVPQNKLVEVRAGETTDASATAPTAAPSASVAPSASASAAPPASASASASASTPAPPASSSVAPPPPGGEPRPAATGLPPIVFWIGAGATVLLAGGGVAGGVVTSKAHDKFTSHQCDTPTPQSDCKDLSQQGKTAMYVTDALFVGAAVTGVASVVVGLAFTRWSGANAGAPSVAIVPGGAVAGYGAKF